VIYLVIIEYDISLYTNKSGVYKKINVKSEQVDANEMVSHKCLLEDRQQGRTEVSKAGGRNLLIPQTLEAGEAQRLTRSPFGTPLIVNAQPPIN
jgi:hypothetical protein